MNETRTSVTPTVQELVAEVADEVVAVRRHLHAHPETSWLETRTCALVASRLEREGVYVRPLARSGVVAEVGDPRPDAPVVALRADLDALPLDDETDDPWRSTVPGVTHACGHDVHVAALLGAGLALHARHQVDPLPGRVRLLFQPAEEVMPGGAVELVGEGVLEGVQRIFAVHCDPSLDVGQVGLRVGAITAAADAVTVRLKGRGGHTSRPHLTQDLTFALAKVVTDVPAALSRRLDPRSGASMVWGSIHAGAAKNVIPGHGEVAGTLRLLDIRAWDKAQRVVDEVVHAVVQPYGVIAEVEHVRGVPPVVNEPLSVQQLTSAATSVVGATGVVGTEQSLGGEDFSWYLEHVPGAMARLGTRTPGGPTYDLHQGDLRVDDGAVPIGAALLAQAALRGLAEAVRSSSEVDDVTRG
ncbi:M20 family metallopeptidase [Angustibacter peucedani]